MNRFLILLFLAIFSTVIVAQEQESTESPLVTDRPTQSASPYTVGMGVLQFETGFLFQKSDIFLFSNDPLNPGVIPADLQSITYNTTLVRYGITDDVELRFTQDLRGSRALINDRLLSSSGAELLPTSIGAKVRLFDESGLRPAMSVLANVGGAPFSDLDVTTTFDFRFNFQHQATEKLAVAYNLGGIVGDQFVGLYTFVAAYALAPKLSVFGELFGFFNPSGVPNDHQVDFGFTYLLSPNLQVDAVFGAGLSDISPNTTFGFGFSARIPKR